MATTYSPDPEKRWRPKGTGREPVCGYTFRDKTCTKRGPHYCEPRADKAVAFFAERLLHTKGPKVRRPFILAVWQELEIHRPIFGEVVYSLEYGCYIRRYRIVYIVVARKNGKSEYMGGNVLLLLVADDEEASEVYGAAKDTKQAGKVFEPALRMKQLSPQLNARIRYNKNARRLIDEKTFSYYEIMTADAKGELGHNPHGFVLDEVLSQPDSSLWDAVRTGEGARLQPLFMAITTETNDPYSFGAELIDEAEAIMYDPARAPHIFAWVRKLPSDKRALARLRKHFKGHPDLPVSLDPFDERNWKWPNPALDDFKSRQSLRDQALEAHNEPSKENTFRQFQMNQRVQQTTRYIPLELWDANVGEVALTPEWGVAKLLGKRCWAGLDLSSKLDLTAWALLFEDGTVRWRFWIPESRIPVMDERTGGQFGLWCKDGWITATEGDAIDYDQVYEDIEADHKRFAIVHIGYDKWCGEPVRQEVEKRTGLEMYELSTTYQHMTVPMGEFMRRLQEKEYRHLANPVARWMADCLEAKNPTDDPDRIRPVKPSRDKTGKRIDGLVALFMAEDARLRGKEQQSVYETRGLVGVNV
jgi:phage terminase large subunit-like protein